ncbi:LAGLIDADG family homing endonuclease [Candidatus Woesebacteria bacterium]|nr:LAGLIDADG family homing endonuclease [Candidatus Woesebacteria bacterium]
MIDPNYISGYVDGEGSFLVSFSPREKLSTGLEVRPSFSVSQRKDRSEVLNFMKSYFGCGSIRFSKRDQTQKYEVRSLKNLNMVIIPHFKKYRLLSSKFRDFEVFSQICEMMRNGRHQTKNGLIKIINNALIMNKNGSRRYFKEYLLSRLKI